MKIAVLYTCFNRKPKTLESLESVFNAANYYNSNSKELIQIEVFLTDDGCTDGTAEAIKKLFADKNIHILHGTGNMYWAGGMRFAWNEALKHHQEWSFYLLMNDDTYLFKEAFEELLETHKYCLDKYKKEGIYSGITCSKENPDIITYGGDIIPNKFNGRQIRLGRGSSPQMVDLTNANILLVPKSLVDAIGIFYEGYKHGRADNDYSMLARRKGFPVLITAEACGTCENDHGDPAEVRRKIINMTQRERSAYFNHPVHCNSDYLIFIRRNMPARYPLAWVFRMLQTYFPRVYYKINKARGI